MFVLFKNMPIFNKNFKMYGKYHRGITTQQYPLKQKKNGQERNYECLLFGSTDVEENTTS